MAWILQGNPKRFDVDDYLARYSYIYWSTPTNQKDFSLGDRVFIWRADDQAGAIAIGKSATIFTHTSGVTNELIPNHLLLHLRNEQEVQIDNRY